MLLVVAISLNPRCGTNRLSCVSPWWQAMVQFGKITKKIEKKRKTFFIALVQKMSLISQQTYVLLSVVVVHGLNKHLQVV